MGDPVVSYRYGKRPIIDVPAMQVKTHETVPSLQKPYYDNYIGDQIHPGLTRQPPPRTVDAVLIEPPVAPRPFHSAPAPAPFHYNQYYPHDRPPRDYYYGPQGEVVKPLERYFDPGIHYPGLVHPQPPPPPPLPPPHQRSPYPLPPPNPHYHFHPPPNYDRNKAQSYQEFDINCDLEHGRVARISVRESRGHFRGIPDYLRKELQKCYGKYPFLQVKIKFQNGDFHIYANHDGVNRRRREQDRERERDLDYDDGYDDYERDLDYERGSGRISDVLPPRRMDVPRAAIRDSY